MLLLLTIALVIVGAVALLIGFVNDQMFPIYLSIACSVLAAGVLLVFSRLSRTRVEPATRVVTDDGPATAVLQRSEASGGGSGSEDDDLFPIADYDDLRVSEILPLLPELDLDELELVSEREEAGRSRASILRRIGELRDELEGAPAAADTLGDDDDDLFPIEDYDDLRVSEILPLLDELESDELEDVATRERAGAARASILGRVDALLGTESAATITAPRAASAAKKAPAKKAATKKAAPAKAAATKAPARKAPAKKAAATKKTAAGTAKKAATKKAATKKATASKAPAKKAAKKAGGAKRA